MKFAAVYDKTLYREDGTAEVTFATRDRQGVKALAELAGVEADVEVKKHRSKRTVRANAYFWQLLDKLARALSQRDQKPVSAEEVYAEYVRDYGRRDFVYLYETAAKAFCEAWRQKGLGWLAIPQENHGKAVQEVQVFYGSSVYDREEMARLIDAVVADCKELGIETKTPEEIADMLSLMESKK